MGFGDFVEKVFDSGGDLQGRRDRDREAELKRQVEADRIKRLNEAKKKQLGILGAREQEAKSQLIERGEETGLAIDQELKSLTSQIGFRAGEARKITAGSVSNQGLLRSSLAGERLGEVSQRELQQKTGATIGAEQRKQTAGLAVTRTINALADQRAALSERINAAKRQQEITLASTFDISKLESDFQTQLSNIRLDQAKQTALIGSIGSLLGDLATIGIVQAGA